MWARHVKTDLDPELYYYNTWCNQTGRTVWPHTIHPKKAAKKKIAFLLLGLLFQWVRIKTAGGTAVLRHLGKWHCIYSEGRSHQSNYTCVITPPSLLSVLDCSLVKPIKYEDMNSNVGRLFKERTPAVNMSQYIFIFGYVQIKLVVKIWT